MNTQIVFIHLDLGIGGAEQLVLNLASASLQAGHDVHLVTCVCRQDHCFDIVKKPTGALSQKVHVWGEALPASILGVGTAFFSSLRLLYLAHWTTRQFPHADIVVLDVLPTPIPLLLPYTSVLFYSHFPDKLLTRDTVNGEYMGVGQSLLKKVYRKLLDAIEEGTMGLADVLVVNSNFTRTQVERVFPSLREKPMRVLYPALSHTGTPTSCGEDKATHPNPPIVSLNRYERKKNIELLLQAYALLKQTFPKTTLPPLIVAGGYDVANVENVEYLGELTSLASTLAIPVQFRRSISEQERHELLHEALCVVYTPHLEHFGIVPLETMAAGTPVVAVNSGGPKETIVDGVTGYLCDNTPESFATALGKLISNPSLAQRMGAAGRKHVVSKFGQSRFQHEWLEVVKETMVRGQERRGMHTYVLCRSFLYVLEGIVMLVSCWILTVVLRQMGVLEEDAHIVGSIRRALFREEL